MTNHERLEELIKLNAVDGVISMPLLQQIAVIENCYGSKYQFKRSLEILQVKGVITPLGTEIKLNGGANV